MKKYFFTIPMQGVEKVQVVWEIVDVLTLLFKRIIIMQVEICGCLSGYHLALNIACLE